MANITVNRLLKAMRRRFKTTNVSEFDDDFLDALRQTVGMININADLETRITVPTSTEGDLALDETYEYVVVNSMIVQLWKLGNGLRKDDDGAFINGLERRLPEDIDMIRQDVLNQAVDADDDDESDFVGLGALG